MSDAHIMHHPHTACEWTQICVDRSRAQEAPEIFTHAHPNTQIQGGMQGRVRWRDFRRDASLTFFIRENEWDVN